MIFFLQKYGKNWFSISSFFFLKIYVQLTFFFQKYFYFKRRASITEPNEGISWKYEGTLIRTGTKTIKFWEIIHTYREYRPVIRNGIWIPTFSYDTEKMREDETAEIQEKIYMISFDRQCFCKINIPNT